MEGLLAFSGMISLLVIVVAIVWFFLPFAVFGMKPKMDAAILELQKANKQLAEVTTLLRGMGVVAPAPDAPSDAISQPVSPDAVTLA